MSHPSWKWRERVPSLSERRGFVHAIYVHCRGLDQAPPKLLNSRKPPLFLYDFFPNSLPLFYGESCLIHGDTSHQLVFEWKADLLKADLLKDENRLNLAMLVKL